MADITYCDNTDCPFEDCERHPTKISDAALKGRGYVSVSNLGGVCRRYISYLVEIVRKENHLREVTKMVGGADNG